MPRIGLTGGIASGKTLVADALARFGASVIDADVIAREVVEPGTPGLAAVAGRFGHAVLQPDGTLDRARLAEVVFADDSARAELNAIVHPLVRRRAAELEQALPPGAVVLHVIPLLVETGQAGDYDGIIVVDAPVETQVSRLMHRNDLTSEAARARVRAQAPRTDRLAAADWVVDNSGDEASTLAQVRQLWDGPLTDLRRREEARGRYAALPSRVRGPEATTDARALLAFIQAQQAAAGEPQLSAADVEPRLPSARVLRMRGAIVGAVLLDLDVDPPTVIGPWAVPGIRDVAGPLLVDAALSQARPPRR